VPLFTPVISPAVFRQTKLDRNTSVILPAVFRHVASYLCDLIGRSQTGGVISLWPCRPFSDRCRHTTVFLSAVFRLGIVWAITRLAKFGNSSLAAVFIQK
jgi:hypothetical protein